MEFGRYVVLSTVYVRCATGELLTAWSRLEPVDQPLAVAPTQYGWFLPMRALAQPIDPRLPEEVIAILAFGRSLGCDYVLLDCDGDREAALPVFPW